MALCNSLFSWLKRMAHQNVDQVKKILRSQNIFFKNQKFCCEDCIIGKMYRLSFPKSDTKWAWKTHPCRYFRSYARKFAWRNSIFHNDERWLHWRSLYFIKNKSETSRCLENFFKKTDKLLEKGIIIFRSDNGLEFVNKEIEEHLDMALLIRERYHLLRNRMIPPNGKIEP